MSEWMSRCVERVEERLKLLPQILQLKLLSCKRQHSVSVEKLEVSDLNVEMQLNPSQRGL